jgi:putative membrane protein (TIGR04086 family)
MQSDPRQTGAPPPIQPSGFFTGVEIRPVIVGVVVDYIATYAATYAFLFFYLAHELAKRGDLSPEAIAEYMRSPEGLTASFAIGAFGTIAGGFVAGRKASGFEIKHGAFVGLGSLAVSFVEQMIQGEAAPVPEWFRALSVLSIIPAGALGGYLAQVSKRWPLSSTRLRGRPPGR